MGTALSGAAAGDFSAAAGAAAVLKTFNLGAPAGSRLRNRRFRVLHSRRRYPCGLGQSSGLSLRQGFLGLRYLGKGILNLGVHGRLGLRSGSGFLFLQLRRKARSFLFGSYTGGLLFCGNARGFGSLLLRLDSCGFLLGSYSRRLLFGSNTGGFLLGSRFFRSNPVRLRLFRCAAGGFLPLLSQLGLQLRSEKTRLDNLHAFRGGRNKLYLGCGRRAAVTKRRRNLGGSGEEGVPV